MTPSHPSDPGALRETLRRATPDVRYDVDAGLARHRELVAGAAPVPGWASALPAARRASQLWLLSSLAVLGVVLGALSFQLLRPAPTAPRAPAARLASALSSRVLPGAVSAAPSPLVQPLPSALPTRTSAEGALAARVPDSAEREAAAEAPLRVPAVTSAARATSAKPSARVAPTLRPALVPAAAPGAAPLPHALVAQLAQGALPVEAPSDEAAPEPARPPSSSAPNSPPPEAIDPLVIEEMQQLATAERLLATMPSRTLSMVREGMRRFPRGYLAQERRYLEIMALLALHMPKDAALLSRGFLRDYPNGPYRRKIERALERGAAE